MIYVYSHNASSQGASRLAQAMGVRRIRHTGSTYRGAAGDTVINWGSHTLPDWGGRPRIINPPSVITRVSNKLSFFRLINNQLLPQPITPRPLLLE